VNSDSRNDARSNDERDPRGEFQRSVERLERAVQGFVSAANDRVSNRAADFIDETAQRLERELGDRNRSRAAPDADEARDASREESREEKRRRRRHRRRQYRSRTRNGSLASTSPGYRTSRLYLDKRHQRICGVCAGIARYFGVEVWVVRGIAITGIIFMASIVIPAYVIAAIVLPRAPDDEAADTMSAAADHTSPAPELGTRLSPRGSLRNVQADLDQLELKLRRMESHVTSGQFELQRELKRIDV
jgi:phage shock protein C